MVQWLRNLGHSLGAFYGLATQFWGKLVDVKDKTLNLFRNIEIMLRTAQTIFHEIQTFKMNPKWNSRVILAPRVVEKIQDLMQIPQDIATHVRDLVKLLKEKIQPAEINTEDAEGLDGAPLKLAKLGERILGWATLLIDSLLAIESAVDDINAILDDIRTVLEDLRGLDALFLPQGNPKKTVDVHYRRRIRS